MINVKSANAVFQQVEEENLKKFVDSYAKLLEKNENEATEKAFTPAEIASECDVFAKKGQYFVASTDKNNLLVMVVFVDIYTTKNGESSVGAFTEVYKTNFELTEWEDISVL